MRVLRPLLSRTIGDMRGHLELCGFGVVAAAARSMQLIARHQPENVILVGIAGSYRSELPVGCARNFLDVACVGIGVGTGSNHQSAGEIGWEHWTSERSTESGTQHAIGDILPLSNQVSSRLEQSGRLLTVCAQPRTTRMLNCDWQNTRKRRQKIWKALG